MIPSVQEMINFRLYRIILTSLDKCDWHVVVFIPLLLNKGEFFCQFITSNQNLLNVSPKLGMGVNDEHLKSV